MKYVIWGAGFYGERVFNILTSNSVIAFIDNDKNKQGNYIFNKPIITFEKYMKEYFEYPMVISTLRYKEIVSFLQEQNFYNYAIFDGTTEISFNYVKKFLSKYKATEKLGIYGTNFLGLAILNYLENKNFKNIEFVGEVKNKNNQYLHRFNFSDIDDSFDYIIVTNKNWEKSAFNNNIKIDDLFDRFDNVTEYSNSGLIKFKNIHLGKRCFVIGNGPSLSFTDLECLHSHKEISFGVNLVYNGFEYTNWRPTYYFMQDYPQNRERTLKSLDLPCLFIGTSSGEDDSSFWNNFSDERFNRVYFINKSIERLPKFSEDVSNGVYSCGTVIYTCLQFAAYMGFKEIYLLGLDTCYSGKYVGDKDHFITNYEDKNNKEEKFFFADNMFNAYQVARHYAERHGIKIYNATRGGKLEVFERVNFDDLF